MGNGGPDADRFLDKDIVLLKAQFLFHCKGSAPAVFKIEIDSMP